MTLDLSLSALVNTAGAFLFFLVGSFMLLVGRRRAVALSAVVGLLGLTYIFENLVVPDSPAAALLISASPAALLIAQVALVLQLAKELAPTQRAQLAAFALAIVVLAAISALGASGDPIVAQRAFSFGSSAATTPVTLAFDLIGASWGGLLVVAAALALRAKLARDADSRRAWLLAALAIGLFGAFVTSALAPTFATASVGGGTVFLVGTQGLVVSVAVAAPFFLPSRDCSDQAVFRRAFFAFVFTALVGCALAVSLVRRLVPNDFGAFGIVRTIGVALLVLAIVRFDLLGVPLPRIVVRRGALATGALASLLIVAQVAQNFLAAQYGLLMGGIVAGAFLFAASPLQRAIENARSSRAGEAPEREGGSQPTPRSNAYRHAVRLALRGGPLSRAEEARLAHVADALGLGHAEAHAILVTEEKQP